MSKRSENARAPLDPLIEGYLEYLADVSRLAPRTIVDVRCTLRGVCGVLAAIRPDKSLWQLPLTDFLRWIEQERQHGRSTSNISKQLSHVRGLLNYAWRSGRSDRNVLDGFHLQDDRKSRLAPGALSLEEMERLLKSCRTQSATDRRDRIVILLLYGCGLRTSELCDLRVQDIDPQRKELLVLGKGDRQRIVPLPEVVLTELLAYLVERQGKRGPLLRTVAKLRRLRSKDVCDIVSATAERAGLTWKVTPKVLRHTYATHLQERGVDVAVIARLMGHRSLRETNVYLHALKDRPQAAVHRLEEWQDAQFTDSTTGDAAC
jgi:integrase/recombinase XerD